jgi:hypothetical protein
VIRPREDTGLCDVSCSWNMAALPEGVLGGPRSARAITGAELGGPEFSSHLVSDLTVSGAGLSLLRALSPLTLQGVAQGSKIVLEIEIPSCT